MTLVEDRGGEILRRMPARFHMIGAEVGVYDGRLSGYLLREHRNLTLLMVDRWRGVPDGHRYKESGSEIAKHGPDGWADVMRMVRKNIAFAGGRGCPLRGESVDIAKMLMPEFLDFVFIDADHTYEGVREDIAAWRPLVRPGGYIGGHDWDHPEDHIGGGPDTRRWGVERAVREFFEPHEIELGKNRTWFVQVRSPVTV